MAKTYSSDSLDRFGDDMCELLLSYLSLEEKFQFQCVSKQWERVVFTTLTILSINHSFAQRLIPKKRLNPFLSTLLSLKRRIKSTFGHKVEKNEYNWRLFETMLKKCTNISSIHLFHSLEDKAIDLIMKHCSHLTDIHINFNNISVETIDNFFTTFGPQLKTNSFYISNLRVDKKCLEKWVEMCVNVQTLYIIRSHSSLSLQSVTESRFKRLNSIHLCPSDQDMTALDAFADQYVHQIKTITIDIWNLTQSSVNTLANCLRPMRALVKITIFSPPLSSQQLISLLAKIGTNCWRLKSLFVCIKELTPDLINTISERFPRLKRLHLRINHMSGEPLTSHSLSSLKRLTHLHLEAYYFTDTFFANIGHNSPKLQYLDVKSVKISDESLISLSGLRQIRGITLTGNSKNGIQDISEMSVNNLKINCPKLCFVNLKTI